MSYGFLINVYDPGILFPDGTYQIKPAKYKGDLHYDPPFMPPYHYGDHPENKMGLKSLRPYDVLIFHTTLKDEHESNRYIIGGFYVKETVLVGNMNEQELMDYQNNPHVDKGDLTATIYKAETLFFDKYRFYLEKPLLFTTNLADILKLKVKWNQKHTPYQQIAWATRAVRKIDNNTLNLLHNYWRTYG